MSKIKLNILVEGQTEEAFVRNYLSHYLESINKQLEVSYQVLYGVGGVSKIRNHIINWHKNDSNAVFTTMIDFYEFPKDIIGYDEIMATKDLYKRVTLLEDALHQEVLSKKPEIKFLSNIQLHEFEAILYTDLDKFEIFYDYWQINKLKREVKDFPTPEHINNGLMTAPSKRILHQIHQYSKRTAGPKIAAAIGIENIRNVCKHFDEWIAKLEKLK